MAAATRKSYLSDLTDEQWALLEPLLPPAKHDLAYGIVFNPRLPGRVRVESRRAATPGPAPSRWRASWARPASGATLSWSPRRTSDIQAI